MKRLTGRSWILFGLIASVCFFMTHSVVQAFDSTYPDQTDTSSTAPVKAVNGETRFVRKTGGTIRIWFPTTSGGAITIKNGNFCNNSVTNPGDYIQSGDKLGWSSLATGASITKFSLYKTQTVATAGSSANISHVGKKYPSGDSRCNDTIVFSTGALTLRENSFYFVDLDVNYVSHAGTYDGVQNYYTITSSTGSLIGIPGDQTGYQSTQEQTNSSPNYINYYVPFGTNCTVSGSESASISFYDLDNAGGGGAQPTNGARPYNGDITVKLLDITTGNYVNFSGATSGSFPGVGSSVWDPGSVDNAAQRVSFTALEDHKYKMEIVGVYYNNTIQYSVPYSQIYRYTCQEAKLKANADIVDPLLNLPVGSVVPPGTTVKFRNWVTTSQTKNTGADTFTEGVSGVAGLVAGSLAVPNGGIGSTPSVANTAISLDPDGAHPGSLNYYTVTLTALGKYCRKTTIVSYPANYAELYSPGATTMACITVSPLGAVPTCTVSVVPATVEPGQAFSVAANIKNDSLTPLTSGTQILSLVITKKSGGPAVASGPVAYDGTTPPHTAGVVNPLGGLGTGTMNVAGLPFDSYTATFSLSAPGGPYTCTDDFDITAKPYFKVVNGDINAAGKFGSTDPAGSIVAFNKGSNPYDGSSAQIAAFATDAIDQFVSADKGGSPAQPTLLSFAANAGAGDLGYGGGFDSILMPDYWGSPASTSASWPGHASDEEYVSGDAYVNANVMYGGSWNIGSVPTYKLVVRGDIYIAAGVAQLDGAYIALKDPVSGKGGNIYTCAPSAAVADFKVWMDTAANITACRASTLQVNGALIAESSVKLLRGKGTLADSATGLTNAAEIVKYSPEVWLQALNSSGGGGGTFAQDADSLVSLPPVL